MAKGAAKVKAAITKRKKEDQAKKSALPTSAWVTAGAVLIIVVIGSIVPTPAWLRTERQQGSARRPSSTLSCTPNGPTVRGLEGRLQEGGWRAAFQDMRQLVGQCMNSERSLELFRSLGSMLERTAIAVDESEGGEWREAAAGELRVVEYVYRKAGNAALALEFMKRAAMLNPTDMQLRGMVASSATTVKEKIAVYNGMLEDLEMWAESEKKRELVAMINHNLGNTYHNDVSDYTLATLHYERSIAADPSSNSLVNLSIIKREEGFLKEAKDLLVSSIPPWTLMKHQNLINVEFYEAPAGDDALSSSKRMEEMRVLTNSLQGLIDQHLPAHRVKVTADCRAGKGRPLHVSFVSSNLGLHRAFLEPVLRAYKRERLHVEVWAKMEKKIRSGDGALDSMIAIPDVVWHDMDGLDTQELTEQLLTAPTDILVEMGRHTAGNALLLISQIKPAPVAVSWVGGAMVTSGVTAMDAIICDKHHCPEGVGIERYFTERIYRMPHTYAPFSPDSHFGELAIRDSPMVANGYVTFGSKNKLAKINGETVRLWATILQRVPSSRLLIQAGNVTPAARERLLGLFKEHRIKQDRVTIESSLPKAAWLDSFNDIDVMLDTWPYCGGLTTLHALYMGTPVVTLCKESGPYWGCHSAAYVRSLLDDGTLVASLSPRDHDSSSMWGWAATTERDYIQTAIALATKQGIHGKGGVRLASQRMAIRRALLSSPIATPEFTAAFEDTLEAIWQDIACPLDAL